VGSLTCDLAAFVSLIIRDDDAMPVPPPAIDFGVADELYAIQDYRVAVNLGIVPYDHIPLDSCRSINLTPFNGVYDAMNPRAAIHTDIGNLCVPQPRVSRNTAVQHFTPTQNGMAGDYTAMYPCIFENGMSGDFGTIPNIGMIHNSMVGDVAAIRHHRAVSHNSLARNLGPIANA